MCQRLSLVCRCSEQAKSKVVILENIFSPIRIYLVSAGASAGAAGASVSVFVSVFVSALSSAAASSFVGASVLATSGYSTVAFSLSSVTISCAKSFRACSLIWSLTSSKVSRSAYGFPLLKS